MSEDSMIAHGGMFRCCIASILELPKEADKDGAVGECKYACGGKFRYSKDHWEVVLDMPDGSLKKYQLTEDVADASEPVDVDPEEIGV